jgi:hypothetical protein
MVVKDELQSYLKTNDSPAAVFAFAKNMGGTCVYDEAKGSYFLRVKVSKRLSGEEHFVDVWVSFYKGGAYAIEAKDFYATW